MPTKHPPKAGDGTQVEKEPVEEANWYGHVTRPQEEFIDDGKAPGEGTSRDTPSIDEAMPREKNKRGDFNRRT